jgi:hypothetical protein
VVADELSRGQSTSLLVIQLPEPHHKPEGHRPSAPPRTGPSAQKPAPNGSVTVGSPSSLCEPDAGAALIWADTP